MRGVLIRDIEMPNTCRECFIGNPKNKTCYILGLPKRNLEIREDCPLQHVDIGGRSEEAEDTISEEDIQKFIDSLMSINDTLRREIIMSDAIMSIKK